MILAKRIRETRLERGLTRETLARAIGVSERTVSFWENEINEPKAGYVAKLAKFFGVSSDYLLGLTD